jgi:predicted CXXCH cytochrome family protein
LLHSKRVWGIVTAALLVALTLFACGPTTRYRTLRIFFDGVPEPGAQKRQTVPAGAANEVAHARTGYSQHGPYAARLCNGCHNPQTNALVAPAHELCFRCHELNLNRRYVHGPIASGGCLVCHDPHASRYRYLLVSDSDSFCFHCHDRQSIEQDPAHKETQLQCTVCHDAHMSDKRFLLK